MRPAAVIRCHDASHSLAAKLGGDPTAFHGGQVTLNPIPHHAKPSRRNRAVFCLSRLFWLLHRSPHCRRSPASEPGISRCKLPCFLSRVATSKAASLAQNVLKVFQREDTSARRVGSPWQLVFPRFGIATGRVQPCPVAGRHHPHGRRVSPVFPTYSAFLAGPFDKAS